jgi:orotidine-5'-phosphate decarboxylase
MNFQKKLNKIIDKNNSLVCIGLDSDFDKLPHHIKEQEHPQFIFNKAIIDATHEFVCCYKPNSAFYEAQGASGIAQLKMTCDYITATFPEITIILDAKRGDIDSTNEAYAKYAFDYLRVDAITVMPYMGIASLSSFFQREGKGIIIGCHSSNPGAKEFQELVVQNKPLYYLVAEKIMSQYGNNPNCMIFMGATYPEELQKIRDIVGDMTLLVPGVGAQDGEVEKAVKKGLNSQNRGMLVNSSRGIIFASNNTDFAEKARLKTMRLRDDINTCRK